MAKHKIKRKKSRIFLLGVLSLTMLASVFLFGAYLRDVVDESTPEGVVTAYFEDIQFGNRAEALDLWNVNDEKNRRTIAFLATDELLGYRGDIRLVGLRKVDYFKANGGPRVESAEEATYAELSGSYRTFGGTKNFRMTARKIGPGRELLGQRLAVWRLFIVDLDPNVK